jgi:hypothetical protein
MGELWIDPTEVRTAAHRSRIAADAVSEFDCPTWNLGHLPGSAVDGIVAPTIIADRLAGVAAQLRAWATEAQRSAKDFEAVDLRGVQRLGGP